MLSFLAVMVEFMFAAHHGFFQPWESCGVDAFGQFLMQMRPETMYDKGDIVKAGRAAGWKDGEIEEYLGTWVSLGVVKQSACRRYFSLALPQLSPRAVETAERSVACSFLDLIIYCATFS